MAQNIRPAVRKFTRPVQGNARSKANESDTVARLRHFFEDALGYDGVTDISSETEMKGKYVDLCLKIDGNICMLVEAKPRLWNFEFVKSTKPSTTPQKTVLSGCY